MPSFITRVEFHSATHSDYETLHSEMGREGFLRTIASDQGVRYHLPTAEYSYIGSTTAADVLERAKRAAAKTRKTFGAIVTEANGSTWHNLPMA